MHDQASGVAEPSAAPDQERYRGCPVVHTDYRIDRPIFEHFALLNAEREKGPFLWNDSTKTPFWMVTRYEHVHEALRMPEVFSNEVINALNPRMAVRFLPQNLDPPQHTKVRKVLNRWFAPAAVRRLEPMMVEHCRSLVRGLAPRGECDFVTDFALKFPTDMFLVIMGLPIEDGPRFLKWVEEMLSSFSGGRAAIRAAAQIKDYFDAALAERERELRDPDVDFLSRMLTAEIDGERFSREDVLTICMTLMTAGLDTTRSALAYIFTHLATHEQDRRRLLEEPEILPRAIEEFVRLYTLIIQDGRLVTRDVDFHGCPMKKGDVVWLGVASANRDPRKFPRPDEYDPDRPNLNQHLGFAAGPHRCLGMHLARRELLVALQEWHAQIPHYRIPPGTELMERGGQLTLRSLPLQWEV